jgi:hypothetical protein
MPVSLWRYCLGGVGELGLDAGSLLNGRWTLDVLRGPSQAEIAVEGDGSEAHGIHWVPSSMHSFIQLATTDLAYAVWQA